jgi:hypothetical protein
VYLPVIRNELPDVFQIFDFTDPQTVTGRRSNTTVAPQSLYLMNSPVVLRAAAQTAAALLDDRQLDDSQRVDHVYRLIFNRPANTAEIEEALRFVAAAAETPHGNEALDARASGDDRADASTTAWAAFCQALFCSTQFQYLD